MIRLPEKFLTGLPIIPGGTKDFVDSFLNLVPVSIRYNPNKLLPQSAQAENIPWASHGIYLRERPKFTADPLFHAGTYYVQEASSMLIEPLVKSWLKGRSKPLIALDLCAAPGGKSTHLLSLLPEGSLLVANEVIPKRNAILRENLVKWGNPMKVVTQSEARSFGTLTNQFDLVLVDAPCSGEGLFRKDPEAMQEWSPEAVEICASRQKEILKEIIPCLRPGGLLLYSTCTYENAENDAHGPFLEDSGLTRLDAELPAEWGVQKTNFGWQCWPHLLKGEGFYISAWTKGDTLETYPMDHLKVNPNPWPAELKPHPFLNCHISDNQLWLVPAYPGIMKTFEKSLRIKSSGLFAGEFHHGKFSPSHELAMSELYGIQYPSVELSEENALQYLRKNPFPIQTAEAGWNIIKYKNTALGWIKHLGNRFNNYYPQEWRILKY